MAEALFLTPVMPGASGDGLAMRAGLFLEGLARSFRVRCLVIPVFGTPRQPDELVARLATSVDVLPLDPQADAVADLRRRLAEPAARARSIALHPRPSLCRGATLDAAHAVARAAHGASLVHVFRLYLAPFLDVLLDTVGDAPRRPIVTIDVDDAEASTRRLAGDPDADAYERLEAHYLPVVDHVVTAANADAMALAETHNLTRVTAVPNAIRVPGRVVPPPPYGTGRDLVLVGNLSYAPNVDAALWLCHEVLPQLPGASVALVGWAPAPAVTELGRLDQVTVAGSVADVAPWYERARVAVVPVRRGGGTRIKLIEALAHGRPVVSTSPGAAGLDLVPGRDGLVLADDPGAFAAACRRLLSDPSLSARLAARGREAVARAANAVTVAGDIDRLFRSLVAPASEFPAEARSRPVALATQLRLDRLAVDTCQAFAEVGVRAILLKGASFGSWLYEFRLERGCTDVDILIDPAEEPAAEQALARIGFRPAYGRSRAALVGCPAETWVRGHDSIDLHRGLFWGVRITPERSWSVLSARTARLDLGGREVEVLDETARAFHLALHAASSGPTSARTEEDLRRALKRVPMSTWCDALALAATLDAERAFATGLRTIPEGALAADHLGLPAHPRIEAVLYLGSPAPLSTGLARLCAVSGLAAKSQVLARAVAPTPSYLKSRFGWARRSMFHTALAYPAWWAFVARHGPSSIAAAVRAAWSVRRREAAARRARPARAAARSRFRRYSSTSGAAPDAAANHRSARPSSPR
jgi:glycosyltransferase involved in cell wall biosynthesis